MKIGKKTENQYKTTENVSKQQRIHSTTPTTTTRRWTITVLLNNFRKITGRPMQRRVNDRITLRLHTPNSCHTHARTYLHAAS